MKGNHLRHVCTIPIHLSLWNIVIANYKNISLNENSWIVIKIISLVPIGNKPLSKKLWSSAPTHTGGFSHWGRDKIDAIFQTTFSNTFSWMTVYELRLKFHWNLFVRVQSTIVRHWFRQWLGAEQATRHYLNQWWLGYRRIYASLCLNELMQMRRNSIAYALELRLFCIKSLIYAYPEFRLTGCNIVRYHQSRSGII